MDVEICARIMFEPEYISKLIASRGFDTIAIFTQDEKRQIDYQKGTPGELDSCFNDFWAGAVAGSYMVHLYRDGEQDGAGAKRDSTRRRKIPIRKVDQVPGIGYVGGQSQDYDRLREEIFQLKLERETERMEAANSAKAIGLMEKLLSLMMLQSSKAAPTSAGIAAPAGDPEPVSDDATERLAAALRRWQKADPDFMDKIEGVVDMAEHNPETYRQAAAVLSGQKSKGDGNGG